MLAHDRDVLSSSDGVSSSESKKKGEETDLIRVGQWRPDSHTNLSKGVDDSHLDLILLEQQQQPSEDDERASRKWGWSTEQMGR